MTSSYGSKTARVSRRGHFHQIVLDSGLDVRVQDVHLIPEGGMPRPQHDEPSYGEEEEEEDHAEPQPGATRRLNGEETSIWLTNRTSAQREL